MTATTKTLLKKFRKYVVASVLKLSGPKGWIVSLMLDFVIKKGWIVVETKKEIIEKKAKYDKVINNPESTPDQIADAFHDLLNK